jgi:hypothetical protein
VQSRDRRLARELLRVIAFIALAFLPLVLVEAAIIGQQAQAGRESIAAGRWALVRSAADAETVNAILRPMIQNDPTWLTIGLSLTTARIA